MKIYCLTCTIIISTTYIFNINTLMRGFSGLKKANFRFSEKFFPGKFRDFHHFQSLILGQWPMEIVLHFLKLGTYDKFLLGTNPSKKMRITVRSSPTEIKQVILVPTATNGRSRIWIHIWFYHPTMFPIATEFPFTCFSKPMSFISPWAWSRDFSIKILSKFRECCSQTGKSDIEVFYFIL